MNFIIFENYDPQKPCGKIEITTDISDEVLADCVIAPLVNIKDPNNPKVISFGIFSRETLDTKPRS